MIRCRFITLHYPPDGRRRAGAARELTIPGQHGVGLWIVRSFLLSVHFPRLWVRCRAFADNAMSCGLDLSSGISIFIQDLPAGLY